MPPAIWGGSAAEIPVMWHWTENLSSVGRGRSASPLTSTRFISRMAGPSSLLSDVARCCIAFGVSSARGAYNPVSRFAPCATEVAPCGKHFRKRSMA